MICLWVMVELRLAAHRENCPVPVPVPVPKLVQSPGRLSPDPGLTLPLPAPAGAEGVQAGAQGGAVGRGSRSSRRNPGPGKGHGRDRWRFGGGHLPPVRPSPLPRAPVPRVRWALVRGWQPAEHRAAPGGVQRIRAGPGSPPCAATFPQHRVPGVWGPFLPHPGSLGRESVLFRSPCTVRQRDGAKSISLNPLSGLGDLPGSPQCPQTLSILGWGGCRVRGSGWRGTFPCHQALGELSWEAGAGGRGGWRGRGGGRG